MLVDSSPLTALDHTEILGMFAPTVCSSLRLGLSCFPAVYLCFLLLVLTSSTVDHLIVRHQGVVLLLYNCRVVQI